MALEYKDRWVWDFWLVDHEGVYHAFYLQAPRSLGDPELRHWHASVGHAVSTDLETWSEIGLALEPGPPGAWDDIATWTGSVLAANGRWYMFYTGASSAEDGLVQRIGVATSDDLATWQKLPNNPILEADPAWYELLDLQAWHDQAWRDPWVYPVAGGYEMILTARSKTGQPEGRGVIGRASSTDLTSWVAQEPLTLPGEFGQMEVPQRIDIGGRPVLLFSCGTDHLAPKRRKQGITASGCYGLVLDDTSEPRSTAEAFALAVPNLYSCRAVLDRSGKWVVLGFEVRDDEGEFAGRISDPLPLEAVAPALFESSPSMGAPGP